MIERDGDKVIFTCKPEDTIVLDFIEARGQWPDMEYFIQTFIDQRRQQREYDTKVELRALLDDPLAVEDMERVIQEFKDRHGIP